MLSQISLGIPRANVRLALPKQARAIFARAIIVACELRYGALKKASIRLTRQLEKVLSVLDIVPFEAPADSVYAKVRTKLEAAGTPIGGNDLLIASHALALGLVVVTDNEREFDRVDGLKVENWLK